ncbi:MAG TPA: 50S ribosomal protein L18 [Candidatus Saccharimonadales bacterium]|nr:50S ribosomal protein L18 [Candidatus Saccharimonadales bacterium]
MNNLNHKLHNRAQRKNRIRSVITGTAERPRLTVTVSNLHVSAQLVDDTAHKTIAAASTVGQKASGTLTEKAAKVGETIAAQAKTAKVKKVVFDRNGKLYHGRVKALAEAARKAGLEF